MSKDNSRKDASQAVAEEVIKYLNTAALWVRRKIGILELVDEGDVHHGEPTFKVRVKGTDFVSPNCLVPWPMNQGFVQDGDTLWVVGEGLPDPCPQFTLGDLTRTGEMAPVTLLKHLGLY